MKKSPLATLLFPCALAACSTTGDGHLKSLFNGRDLTSWVAVNGRLETASWLAAMAGTAARTLKKAVFGCAQANNTAISSSSSTTPSTTAATAASSSGSRPKRTRHLPDTKCKSSPTMAASRPKARRVRSTTSSRQEKHAETRRRMEPCAHRNPRTANPDHLEWRVAHRL